MEEINPTKTTTFTSNSVTWDEIDLAERYLVCGMFEEAADLSSLILTSMRNNVYENATTEIADMTESAAMVLVQSWRECGRTSDMMNELERYFTTVTEIPIQVVLHSARIQVSSGHSSDVRKFFEEFLAKWQYQSERYFAFLSSDMERADQSECAAMQSSLEVAEYLEVVEFYAVTLLAGILNDADRAILWIEKAQLPEEARQDLLRRLVSLNSQKSASSKKAALSSSLAEDLESIPSPQKEVKESNKLKVVFKTQDQRRINGLKQSFWSRLQNITTKCSSYLAVSNGRILYGCLVFLICYFIQKKRETIKRVVKGRALALKQAIVDLWQLAFSYQVNPLAAVQSLPAPSANRTR